MRRLFLGVALATVMALTGCGDPSASTTRALTAHQALTSNAEVLEFEAPSVRQELFRDVARTSQLEAGRETSEPVLFPIIRDGRLVAAPSLDARADLLQAPDAGHPLPLTFDGREVWPEDRREGLQGLSEREAAELVARTLLSHWGITSTNEILVERAPSAPYAAAYVDGILRLNPSFLYMAASAGPASVPTPLQ